MSNHKVTMGEVRVLLALSHGAHKGLDIQKHIREMADVTGPVSLGGVFTELSGLEKKKWVRSELERGTGRRNYSLTDEGGNVLSLTQTQ